MNRFFLLSGVLMIHHLSSLQRVGAQEAPANDASIKKGTVIVGSYFNFSAVNASKDRVNGFDTKSSTIKLGGNLTFGKMVSNKWGLLLNAGYTSSSATTPITVGQGNNATVYNLSTFQSDFAIAPSLRYYKFVSEGYYLFVQTSAQFTFGTLSLDDFDKSNVLVHYNFNTHGFGMGISPGLTYFMTKKLSTEIAIGVLGFSSFNGKDDKGNTTQTTVFQSFFYQNSVSLGFVYYL
jgi:hypothetical protein